MIKKDLACCVGLWLAEGDNKTNSEITFTNNSVELIEFFGYLIIELFPNLNPRIYAYSKRSNATPSNINIIIKQYVDKRARKPYFIFRVASKDKTKEWKNIVQEICSNKKYYKYILQGFFAGEGNVKYSLKHHNHRSIRISQKNPK